jgi:hypothetical protein
MNGLLERALDGLCERLRQIEADHRYISLLIERRLANEKMLQLEVMRLISLMPEVEHYLPEKPYGEESREKCDFWFKASGTEHWLEIKMRPTNYRKKEHHSKGISTGIDQAIQDIRRLRELSLAPALRFGLLVFYPMYPENYPTFNRCHLSRLSAAVAREIEGPSRSISIGDANLDIYLVEAQS